MYRFLFLWTISTTCLTATAAGQLLVLPNTPTEERIMGGSGQDELFSVAVNWRGDVVCVGNSARGENGGQDICFVAFDSKLNKIVERKIGRKNDDGAGQIATLPDGRYLVAGYSTRPEGRSKIRSNYFGKQDGWLLLLNERGETEREILLGTPENDAFVSVAVCPDGSIWLAGNSGEQVWIVKLHANLELAWEKKVQYHQLPTQATMAALSPEGEFFVIGGIEEMNRKHLWVSGFDAQGKAIMEKIYPSSQAEKGTGIIALNNNTLAIVGVLDDPRDRENGFLSILDRTGVMRHYQALGGREFDQLQALTRLHDGQIAVGGGSASFERGSRRVSAWITILNDSAKIGQEKYYGSKLDDEISALLQHPDGRLFAIGTTARQVLKMRQGWLFQIGKAEKEKASIGSLIPQLGEVVYPANGSFFTNERSFIPFLLKNTGGKGQFNLRAEIDPADTSLRKCLRLPADQTIWLPNVGAGETINWGLPFQFAEGVPPGLYQFNVQFFQGKTKIGEPQRFEVNLGKPQEPLLELIAKGLDTGFVPGQENFLLVEVHNTGAQAANGIILTTLAPEGVQLQTQTKLGNLAAGGKIVYKMPVEVSNTTINLDALILNLRVADESLTHTASIETKINVKTLQTPAALPPIKADYTVAIWVYPNPDNFDRSAIVWTQEEITVQVKIVSNQAVTRQQFCLEINGQACPTGSKFEEVQIKGDKNSKTFSQTVKLQTGENLLRASVQQPNGKISSELLKIIFTPAKPNLHILSIGVPAADLKYTSKDARDFAKALSSDQNTAFGKIFLDTLLTEEQTTKTEILKSLRRIQYRYADLQILPKDMLVIFVSGHGLGAYDGSFRLAASDYDGPFMQETSLDFEAELVNYLQQLPCTKLFFVDACHSGTTASTGLAGIATRKNGLNMLVSCQSDEYSYEDDHWKNGAFTRALVHCLEEFAKTPTTLDLNRNAILELNELFEFIQKEVPNLVDKKRPKAKTGQRPKLILADPNQPLGLFELKKD